MLAWRPPRTTCFATAASRRSPWPISVRTPGVNKGSFYHFFPSKRDLLLEVIDNAWDEDRTARELSWKAGAPQQPIAQLRRYVQELFAYHYADRENVGTGSRFAAGQPGPRVGAGVIRRWQTGSQNSSDERPPPSPSC